MAPATPALTKPVGNAAPPVNTPVGEAEISEFAPPVETRVAEETVLMVALPPVGLPVTMGPTDMEGVTTTLPVAEATALLATEDAPGAVVSAGYSAG